MSLMTLVRLIGAIAIAWTLVAFGLGASGTRLPDPVAAVPPPAEAPPVDAMPANWSKMEGYALVDRANGRRSSICLPEGLRWSIVSVSPWRGPHGELEAAGRWVNSGEGAFCGWGLFRLSDGAVLRRIATEILPTGRPCWVPGHPRTIVFPAGDGGLHRCRLAADEEEPVHRPSSDPAVAEDPSQPVTWAMKQPGSGEVFVEDPAWPDDPRLQKWILVALRQKVLRGGRFVYGPSRLWWLEMSEGAERIVAAGRLTRTPEQDTASDFVEERFPNVALGPDGALRLVYLERSNPAKTCELRSAVLDFDRQTGRPMVAAGDSDRHESPEDLQAAPLLVSSDGATVFGLSRSGGLRALPATRRDPAEGDPGLAAPPSDPAGR